MTEVVTDTLGLWLVFDNVRFVYDFRRVYGHLHLVYVD